MQSTSQKQIEANRKNSQRSTGPKTLLGKEKIKANPIKHGILSELISKYEGDSYMEVQRLLEKEMKPSGILENLIVERIVIHYLRMKRIAKAEKEMMEIAFNPKVESFDSKRVVFNTFKIEGYNPYIPTLSPSEVEQLLRIYQRYDTTEENRFYKAMHELERLQRIRKGEEIAAPVQVDINKDS